MAIRRTLSRATALWGRFRYRATVTRWWASAALSHWRWLAHRKWQESTPRNHRRRTARSSNVVRGRRVALAALHKTYDVISSDPKVTGHERWVALGCGVVRAFLTREWFDRHVMRPSTLLVATLSSGTLPK